MLDYANRAMRQSTASSVASDRDFMRVALANAEQACAKGEVPVGAVIVSAGEVIAASYNSREERQSPLGHAEITAIERAARRLSSWRLDGCDLYVTLEPCIMCAGAILQARIHRLVYACRDPKAGAVASLYRLCEDSRLNHQVSVIGGLLADESAAMLADFFSQLRIQKRHLRKAKRWLTEV